MKRLSILLFLFTSVLLKGQSGENREAIEAALFHSLKLNKNFSLKSAVIGRDGFLTVFQIPNLASATRRLDFQTALEKKIRDQYSIAAGAMYRIIEVQNAFRTFQQFAWSQKVNGRIDKLAHRLRIDQTFQEQSTEIRFRYRFAFESPLSGYRLDIEENYFAFTFEGLQKFKEEDSSRELRINPRFGRLFKNKNKAEIGIDFRYERPFSDQEVRLFLLQFRHYLTK